MNFKVKDKVYKIEQRNFLGAGYNVPGAGEMVSRAYLVAKVGTGAFEGMYIIVRPITSDYYEPTDMAWVDSTVEVPGNTLSKTANQDGGERPVIELPEADYSKWDLAKHPQIVNLPFRTKKINKCQSCGQEIKDEA